MLLSRFFCSAVALGSIAAAAVTSSGPSHHELARSLAIRELTDPVIHLNLSLTVPIKEIEQTIENVVTGLAKEGKKIADLTAEAAKELASTLKIFIEEITDDLESTAEYIEAQIKKGAKLLNDALQKGAHAIYQTITALLAKIEDLGQLLYNTLKEELHGLAQAGLFLLNKLEDVAEGLVKVLQTVLEAFAVRAHKVGVDIGGLLGLLGKSLGQILHDLLFG